MNNEWDIRGWFNTYYLFYGDCHHMEGGIDDMVLKSATLSDLTSWIEDRVAKGLFTANDWFHIADDKLNYVYRFHPKGGSINVQTELNAIGEHVFIAFDLPIVAE